MPNTNIYTILASMTSTGWEKQGLVNMIQNHII